MTTLPFLFMAYFWAHGIPSLILVTLFVGLRLFSRYDSLTALTWISGVFLVLVVWLFILFSVIVQLPRVRRVVYGIFAFF